MDKWRGSFAQTQLEKFGWESGEGLGKNKEGNVKHISVSVKNDKKGVGVNGSQWEFAWWDHLYNKSASSVVVAKEEGEIKVATKTKGDTRRSKTGIISTERPTGKSVQPESDGTLSSMADQRNMMDSVKDIHINIAQRVASASLYGSFVKSASTSAVATPTLSDKEEDDELKDYSIKVSDADLFAACEGRTARKGGRGLVDQTGKFKRVMKDFVRPVDPDEQVDEKKKKSKKRKHDNEDDDEKKVAKKAKKAKKEAKKVEKEAKKVEKEAKKAEKEVKKAEKKAKKESKKASKKEEKNKD
ncbi:G patch domain-containing protein 4 [Rhizopus stolonifer]|uniref:G patch domain-containing protein 4 n=1 Tax=Rhizopus stolonifer TaxID=4846 RepID=A0A367ISC1_RHIST|nr:G patch domain-containing protein 4 [Rhizopus stolonifer]